MKTISIFIIGLSLLVYCTSVWSNTTFDKQRGVQPNYSGVNTLNIVSSPELKSLTTNWVSEYVGLNPDLKISTRNITDNQATLSSELSFISDKNSDLITDGTNWIMVIGRDAVVPIINAKNPMLKEIYRQGVSPEELALILTEQKKQNWMSLISGGQNSPIHYYVIDNNAIKTAISNFAKINSSVIGMLSVGTPEELLSAVQKDIYAIGFCKLVDVRNPKTNDFMSSIKPLPIDKNKNGRIDNFENIYSSMDEFTRGVWIGKYPTALCGNIYVVSSSKPTEKNALDFLAWINADGQKYLNTNGYSNLVSSEKSANLAALLINPEDSAEDKDKPFLSDTWLIVIITFGTFFLVLAGVVVYAKSRKANEIDEEIDITPAFDENSILAPKGLYFDKSHTWAYMEKDGNVKIGLDDFLQHITGAITRVKMKEPGEKIRKGEKILTIIQNGKQLNISSPISGIIKFQNQILTTDSSILNSAPYSDGWVYLIEPKNWLRDIQFLFMAKKYKEWLQDEFIRIKDFLAASVKSNTSVYAHVILQDGGELTDNVLANLGPEVWEDFQTKFIDTSK
jgi:glycine cleavage system H lipoate-binding protein/ABC-type phosphate transport system substrate-binding protein